MSSPLGLAILTPSTTAGPISACVGAIDGGAVLQVLNLVTGADVTSSFDPYLPAADTIVQLDTVPSHTATHLVTFIQPGQGAPGYKFAAVRSIGATAGTNGSAAAAGVKSGDTILQAYHPVSNYSYINTGFSPAPIDSASSFDPTAPADGTVTQVAGLPVPVPGVSPGDSILLLLRNNGAPPSSIGIAVVYGPLALSQPVQLPGIAAGSQLLAAFDITNVVKLTGYYDTYAPADGSIDVNPAAIPGGLSILGNVLFIFEKLWP